MVEQNLPPTSPKLDGSSIMEEKLPPPWRSVGIVNIPQLKLRLVMTLLRCYGPAKFQPVFGGDNFWFVLLFKILATHENP